MSYARNVKIAYNGAFCFITLHKLHNAFPFLWFLIQIIICRKSVFNPDADFEVFEYAGFVVLSA